VLVVFVLQEPAQEDAVAAARELLQREFSRELPSRVRTRLAQGLPSHQVRPAAPRRALTAVACGWHTPWSLCHSTVPYLTIIVHVLSTSYFIVLLVSVSLSVPGNQ
jgi:hypothetical protein